MKNAAEYLTGNRYPGRGILVGKSADGDSLYYAYFIMGRSENSRNRVLEEKDGALFTRAFDESKVVDPSLIIYAAMRRVRSAIIVTNGDQTDTIQEALTADGDFFSALETRTYEPDAPNYTPRISALITLDDGDFDLKMSILRRQADGECERARFVYPSKAGVGHLIHTYITDGNPLPSFTGAPKEIAIGENFDDFSHSLWEALDEENRIALFVRKIDLKTGKEQTHIFNKHTRSK